MITISQDNNRKPAKMANLDAWVKQFDVDYLAAVDPMLKFGPAFEADAFPMNLIIDTTTMVVESTYVGHDAKMWTKLDQLVAQ